MTLLQQYPLLAIVLGTVFVEHAYAADIALDYARTLVGKKITVESLENAAVKSADTHGGGVVEFQVWGDTERKAQMHTVLITVSITGQTVDAAEITHQIKCLRSQNGQFINDHESSQPVKKLCDKVLKGLQDAKKTTTLEAAIEYPLTDDDPTIKKLFTAIRPTPTTSLPTFKQLPIGGVNWNVVGAATPMNKALTGQVRMLLFIAKAAVKGKIASMQILVSSVGATGYAIKFAEYALNGASVDFSQDLVTDTKIRTDAVMKTKIQEALKTAAR